MTETLTRLHLEDLFSSSTATSPDLSSFEPGVIVLDIWGGPDIWGGIASWSRARAGIRPLRRGRQESATSAALRAFRPNSLLDLGGGDELEMPPFDLEPVAVEPVTEDVLDWEARTEPWASAARGTLRVRLRYAGPVGPSPIESPWAE